MAIFNSYVKLPEGKSLAESLLADGETILVHDGDIPRSQASLAREEKLVDMDRPIPVLRDGRI